MTCDDGSDFEGAFMPENRPQSFSSHARYDPWFHFFILPVFSLLVLAAIVHLFLRPGWHSAAFVVPALATLALVFKVRLYSIKVQDRVIRLEERLRLATLIDPSFRARIPEFTESQLIALRFASDNELPALAARALNEKLSAADIKKSIQAWRPDYWRV
jgi:Family of unknown function (DUF6526)